MSEDLKNVLVEVSEILSARCPECKDYCFAWYLFRNCVKAYREFDLAETPEGEALARWSIHDSHETLDAYLTRWQLSPDERQKVKRFISLCR